MDEGKNENLKSEFKELKEGKDEVKIDDFCIKPNNQECNDCNLHDVILCKFSKKDKVGFVIGNTAYRVSAIGILYFGSLMNNSWWLMWVYIALVFGTFIFVEPRLLCSHCPFYAMEGKFLKCGGLWGMPKLWKYHPEPIAPLEQNIMLLLGSLIDLGPFIGIIVGFIAYFHYPEGNIGNVMGLIILTFLFMFLVYYFGKVLLGDRCKRCPNFSCKMNKTPDEYVALFLDKNIVMKKAWDASKRKKNENK